MSKYSSLKKEHIIFRRPPIRKIKEKFGTWNFDRRKWTNFPCSNQSKRKIRRRLKDGMEIFSANGVGNLLKIERILRMERHRKNLKQHMIRSDMPLIEKERVYFSA
ncbi:hypothetical protein Trydic_g19960 [Trypoxylus dichotomus]